MKEEKQIIIRGMIFIVIICFLGIGVIFYIFR